MTSSFISEHTAEFILVPQFYKLLKEEYKIVTPLYFWISREGNNMSRNCIPNSKKIRLVALYARRPKIGIPGQKHIKVKINNILFEHANYLQEHGIPVFAGVPLVSSILELNLETPCSWFCFQGEKAEELILHIDKVSGKTMYDYCVPIKQIRCNEFIDIINNSSKLTTWETAIDTIKRMGRSCNTFSWMFAPYKPVYFVIQDF